MLLWGPWHSWCVCSGKPAIQTAAIQDDLGVWPGVRCCLLLSQQQRGRHYVLIWTIKSDGASDFRLKKKKSSSAKRDSVLSQSELTTLALLKVLDKNFAGGGFSVSVWTFPKDKLDNIRHLVLL